MSVYHTPKWRRRRRRLLRRHPVCTLCPELATVADHFPRSRRELVAQGVVDPDDLAYLRALCTRCHNSQTAKRQPGGWARRPPRKRAQERHPGLREA